MDAQSPSLVVHSPPVVFLKYQQSKAVSHEQAKQANHELQQSHLKGEAILTQGSAPDEPQVEDGKVARLDKLALVVVGRGGLEEPELGEQAEDVGDDGVGLALGRPWCDGGLEQTGSCIEARESVARAGDEAKDLWARVEKVEHLRDEEEPEGL